MLSSSAVRVMGPRPVVAPIEAAASPAPPKSFSDPAVFNTLRRIGVFFGLLYLVIKISYITEAILYLTGLRTFLVPLTLTASILLVIFSGGLSRVFRLRATVLWVLFVLWMIACIPTSHWVGGSFDRVYGYIRYDLAGLLIPAGVLMTWKDMRRYCHAMALAACGVLVTVRFCSVMGQDGRITLAFDGSIANSNDLAAVLLMLAPFLLYCMLDSALFSFYRILCAVAFCYSGYVILGTASRGAFLSISAGVLFWFWKASSSQRIASLVLIPVLALPLMVMLPAATFDRIFNIFGEKHQEAEESADARSHLFRQSVRFTFEHPVFGVGPDQFTNYEGHVSKLAGVQGAWHATHCSWTQISSENGIPGLLLYSGAILSAWLLNLQVLRRSRRLGNKEIANVAFSLLLSMVMYFTCITFLSNAYSAIQPIIISSSVALYFVANRILDEGTKNERTVPLPMGSFPVRPLA